MWTSVLSLLLCLLWSLTIFLTFKSSPATYSAVLVSHSSPKATCSLVTSWATPSTLKESLIQVLLHSRHAKKLSHITSSLSLKEAVAPSCAVAQCSGVSSGV